MYVVTLATRRWGLTCTHTHTHTHTHTQNQDTTFEFEKRRNVPVRYDRELMQTTLTAMKRVKEIRERREKQFYLNRYASLCATTNSVPPPRSLVCVE